MVDMKAEATILVKMFDWCEEDAEKIVKLFDWCEQLEIPSELIHIEVEEGKLPMGKPLAWLRALQIVIARRLDSVLYEDLIEFIGRYVEIDDDNYEEEFNQLYEAMKQIIRAGLTDTGKWVGMSILDIFSEIHYMATEEAGD